MADLSSLVALVKKLQLWTESHARPSSSHPPPSSVPPAPFDPRALRWTVARIEAVLKDAAEREIRDESVRLWLKDLKGVAYDADDLLDELEYERLQAEAEAGVRSGETTLRLPRKEELPDVMITSPSLNASFWFRTADRVHRIVERLEEISKLRDVLHLREGDGQKSSRSTSMMRPPSSHLVDAANPQGRKDDLEKVISMLCSDECRRSSDLFVIPIVGIGGVGKTTLAQLVYNNPEICSLFPSRGWVSVSEGFDLVQLTRRVNEAFTTEECRLQELSVLQQKLINATQGKRFLLVLDDVWNEDPDLWNKLLMPLKLAKKGSAVITTTRSRSVARIMAPTNLHHHLDYLSEEDCWEVFKQNAFHGQDAKDNYQELVEIGKKVAQKCKGLPLAAKSMGCLLSRDYDVEQWRDVLESNVWDVDDKIIPALMLSYVHLPSDLKQCFLYTSLFPKDYAFRKEELVQLWLAQGFIRQRGSRELETVGSMYFEELLNRSFFQNNPSDPSRFVMHDLIHDLAQYNSGGEHIIMETKNAGNCPVQEARHISMVGRYISSSSDFFSLAQEAVRSFLVLPDYFLLIGGLKLPLETMLINLKFLRVLRLSGVCLRLLPESISNLKHLRYLNLEDKNLEILPCSIGTLYHLQTLILQGTRVRKLPTSITGLSNLRCLKVEEKYKYFPSMPRGIGRLTNLRSLNVFNVGEGSEECRVEELKDLAHLTGSLVINDLQNVVDAEKAKKADLEGKTKIWHLILRWQISRPLLDQQEKVLESLRPHYGVTDLTINGFCGSMLPKWLGNPCFSRLTKLSILNCEKLVSLPSLGQLPSLKCLEILSGFDVKLAGSEFRGRGIVGFPVLEVLVFRRMSNWMAWQEVRRGDFPHLRRLEVRSCPQLNWMVPLHHLPALEELVLSDCAQLTSLELWSPSSSSSCSSPSPSPLRQPWPPLKMMIISGCPRACFSPRDDKQLLLPPTLRDLVIDWDCPLLVEWCQTDAYIRLSGIPGAMPRMDQGGRVFVSTRRNPWRKVRVIGLFILAVMVMIKLKNRARLKHQL